jgi:glycosyltransferase involved in cell wall biosynthesis
LVVDGGSVDNTCALAAQQGAQVLRNPHRVAEAGKGLALGRATGDYVLFLDADNELSHPDFLRLAVAALGAHAEALGVESYYPASTRMGSFCAYLTETLHISDPIAWAMSVTPCCLSREGETERWTFPAGSLAYPLGANGFLFRRADLLAVGAEQDFEDTDVALRIARRGRQEWLRIRGRGVHHYTCRGLGDFVRKRRRQTYHFLSRRVRRPGSWTEAGVRLPAWLACLYAASVWGPLWDAFRGWLRDRDARWWWHPVASLASALGVAWGTATYALSKRDANAEAQLQPPHR